MFCALEVLLQRSLAYAALPFLAVLVKALLYFCVVVKHLLHLSLMCKAKAVLKVQRTSGFPLVSQCPQVALVVSQEWLQLTQLLFDQLGLSCQLPR